MATAELVYSTGGSTNMLPTTLEQARVLHASKPLYAWAKDDLADDLFVIMIMAKVVDGNAVNSRMRIEQTVLSYRCVGYTYELLSWIDTP